MEELTIEEIIKYAIRVEQESYQFYRKASRMLGGNELKELIDELSVQEVDHINELKHYIKEDTIVDEELSHLLTVDTSLFERIIKIGDISPCSTPADILVIALDRERTKHQNYGMLGRLDKLSDSIRATFLRLMEMEARHVEMIQQRVDRA